jgi:phenylalanine-4-hydroxylase
VHPSPLYYLEGISQLNLKDNQIEDMDEVAPFLRTMNYLSDLDMRGNGVTRVPKYRDQVVMMGLKLGK